MRMIKKVRQLKFLSDTEYYFSGGQKDHLQLVDLIYEINKENFEEITKKIGDNMTQVYVKLILDIIEYAMKFRPLKIDLLRDLYITISKKYGPFCNLPNEIELIPNNDMIEIIKNDDIGEFQKKLFNEFVDLNKEYVSEPLMNTCLNENGNTYTYAQAIAFFGAVKCFKYARLNELINEKSMEAIDKYAIFGGNDEIIQTLRNDGIQFHHCFSAAVQFHRNKLADWLLDECVCEEISCKFAAENYNDRALAFAIINRFACEPALLYMVKAGYSTLISESFNNNDKINVNEPIDHSNYPIGYAIEYGHLPVVKVLVEHNANLHIKVKDGLDPIRLAEKNKRSDIKNYLINECHLKVRKEKEGKEATEVKTKEYVIENISMQIDSKEQNGQPPTQTKITMPKKLIISCDKEK